MKYCPACLEEYEPSVDRCADCETALVSEEEIARRPEFQRAIAGDDVTRYVLAGTAESVFEADALADAVAAEQIPLMVRPRHASTVGIITRGTVSTWWEFFVPEEALAKAKEAIERGRQELREGEDAAALAAEAEVAAAQEER